MKLTTCDSTFWNHTVFHVMLVKRSGKPASKIKHFALLTKISVMTGLKEAASLDVTGLIQFGFQRFHFQVISVMINKGKFNRSSAFPSEQEAVPQQRSHLSIFMDKTKKKGS